jgi:AcrR family transcriptional regulator
MTSTTTDTRSLILTAGKTALLESGYARLSTRRVAETAGVPLSQIHYHFGSRQNLVLAILADENERLLQRQQLLYSTEMPLWKQWDQACEFLEDDLRSGYVRVLQEMTAAGWSDADIAAAVRESLRGWFELLARTAVHHAPAFGGLGPFTAEEIGALVGTAFLGIETMILLGVDEDTVPCRGALRSVGFLLRSMEEHGAGSGA